MSTLLPPNSSPLERAVEAATTLGIETPINTLWNPDECQADALPWLAWALHVDNWDEAATEAQKRDAIKQSIHLHRKKGTPWAVKRALATLGVEVDLLDQRAQREIYAALDPNRINGTWALDGTRKVTALERITGVPQIQHWAQFIVRMNIAELARPALLDRMRALIDEWKPARSWPLFTFWLRFYFTVTMTSESRFVMQKRIPARYPWCGRVVTDNQDAAWSLGIDGTPASLPAPFGSFAVGRRYGGDVKWWLTQCRNTARAAMSSRSSVPMWPRETLPIEGSIHTHAPIKLFRRIRRLDGAWRIGTPIKVGRFDLSGSTRLARHPMLVANRLGDFNLYEPSREIPDPRPARLSLSGNWRLGGPVSPAFRTQSTRIAHV